ncbi:MAG: hypothetical protein ACXWM7_00545, partial [Parachlamydiaceae bacterium]
TENYRLKLAKRLAESKYEIMFKEHITSKESYKTSILNLSPSQDKNWSEHLTQYFLQMFDSKTMTVKNLSCLHWSCKALSCLQIIDILSNAKTNLELRRLLPYILPSLSYETYAQLHESLSFENNDLLLVKHFLLEAIKENSQSKKWIQNRLHHLRQMCINLRPDQDQKIVHFIDGLQIESFQTIREKHLNDIQNSIKQLDINSIIKSLQILMQMFEEIASSKTIEKLSDLEQSLQKMIHRRPFELLFDRLCGEEWDDDDDITDCFGLLNLWGSEQLRKAGLITQLEFENSHESPSKLNPIALKKLKEMSFKTLKDLKELNIYNSHLLCEYFSKKAVETAQEGASISECFEIFILDTPEALEKCGLAKKDQLKDEMTKEEKEKIFKCAEKKLIKAGLSCMQDLKRLQIYNARLLSEYLSKRAVEESQEETPISACFEIFILDTPQALKNCGLITADQVKDKMREEEKKKIFELAEQKLIQLGLSCMQDLKRLQIYNVDLLSAYISK